MADRGHVGDPEAAELSHAQSVELALAALPRREYSYGTTPIERLPRLSTSLGGPHIYVNRDDLKGDSLAVGATRANLSLGRRC